MKKLFLAAIFCSLPGVGLAENAGHKASPEALDACKLIDPSFNKIAACLPKMDVAIETLTAFSSIYPSEAAPIRAKCEELNKDKIGAATCVEKAVETAVQLKQQIPDGSDLPDPLFLSISDAAKMAELNTVTSGARAKYPQFTDFTAMYQPYR